MAQPSASASALVDSVRWRRPAYRLFVVSLVVAIPLAASLFYYGLRQSDNEALRFIINGEPLALDAADQAELQADLLERLAVLETTLQYGTRLWQGAALARLEADYHAAADAYLDWYFSAPGTYSRLFIALSGDLDAWMQTQLEERLVRPLDLETSLQALSRQHRARVASVEQAWQQKTLDTLQQRYATSADVASADEAIPTVNLDRMMQRAQGPFDLSNALPSHGASLPAGAVAGLAARRLLAGKAMQSARRLLRRFAVRVGIQATRSAAVGAGASAVATPIGGAVATGIGVAATAGAEYIALKREEAKYRPAMEDELHDGWNALASRLRQTLEAQKQARTRALRERLEQQARPAGENNGPPETYRILG
ncbi:hypothetical protein [Halomonas piscis]|uniref:hypothetical protein n=1 Tax=Halomonas piscis TaxID=3031727 RepID=UPI00289BDAC2|nr:hypothetical protein [Halomonas piscis]